MHQAQARHMSRRRAVVGSGALLGLGACALFLAGADPVDPRVHPETCAPAGVARPLEGSVINASPVLAMPTRLEIVGDYLAILDAASDSALHVVDRHTGVLVRSLGRRGRGPGEFQGAWALDGARHHDAAVWVYDVSLRRLTRVPLEGEGVSTPQRWRMISLADGTLLTESRWLDDETLLVAGLFDDELVAFYDSAGRRFGRRAVRDRGTTAGWAPQARQARLVVHPTGTLAALASRYESRVELLALASGAATKIEGRAGLSPDEQSPPSLDRIHYVDVAATAHSVVAVYSGRDSREYGVRAPFGRCLQVFDWYGILRGAFRLDTDVLAIAIDEEEHLLYALVHDPVPAVVRFPLPQPTVPSAVASLDGSR